MSISIRTKLAESDKMALYPLFAALLTWVVFRGIRRG